MCLIILAWQMLRMEAFQIEFAVVRASAISMVAMEEFDYSDLGCDDDDEAVPAPKKKSVNLSVIALMMAMVLK